MAAHTAITIYGVVAVTLTPAQFAETVARTDAWAYAV